MTFGLKDLTRCLAGITVAVPYSIVTNTAIALMKSPRILYNSYKALYKTEKIGIKLKILTSTLIPITHLLSLAVVPLGAACFGIYRGLRHFDELNKLFPKLKKDNTDFIKEIDELFKEKLASKEILELEPNTEKIDIRILQTLKGILVSLSLLPVHLVIFSICSFIRLFKLLRAEFNFVKEISDGNIFVFILCSTIAALLFCIIPIGFVVVGSGYMFGATAVEGYKKGIRAALHKMLEVYDSFLEGYDLFLKTDD